jgi:hypothetical protein
VALHFRPTEDLHGYVTLLAQCAARRGLPVTLYGDGTNILTRNDAHWTLDEQLAGIQSPTHVGRMLHDLGIGFVRARSPQAKGRVERLWATLQDRLVSELRLRGIRTRAAANAFLPEFIEDFNRRFARAALAAPVWRRPPRALAAILSCRYRRRVARDNTVGLGARVIQLPRGPYGRSYASRTADVRECLDGVVLVLLDGHVLARAASPPGEFTLAARRSPSADRPRASRSVRPRPPLHAAVAALGAALRPSRTSRAQPADHPWKRSFKVRPSTPRLGA